MSWLRCVPVFPHPCSTIALGLQMEPGFVVHQHFCIAPTTRCYVWPQTCPVGWLTLVMTVPNTGFTNMMFTATRGFS